MMHEIKDKLPQLGWKLKHEKAGKAGFPPRQTWSKDNKILNLFGSGTYSFSLKVDGIWFARSAKITTEEQLLVFVGETS